MLRLSKLTDYGALVMTLLAREPARLRSATEIAECTHVSPPTVSKLLKILAKSGLVESERGHHGGYRLARLPAQISVAEIIAALEGPLALTECSSDDSDCTIAHDCSVSANWQRINGVINDALEKVSLAEMAAPVTHVLRPAHELAAAI